MWTPDREINQTWDKEKQSIEPTKDEDKWENRFESWQEWVDYCKQLKTKNND